MPVPYAGPARHQGGAEAVAGLDTCLADEGERAFFIEAFDFLSDIDKTG